MLEYARVLRERWRWPAWGAVLAVGLAIVVLLVAPPVYRSTATVFIRTPGDVSRAVDGGDTYARHRAGTYVEFARSPELAARVIADLGLDLAPEELAGRITAENTAGTVLIEVGVGAPTAAEAQQTATVYLSEYAATVKALETVAGSVVPRAELVVVDPPGRPTRADAWGAPIPVVLLGAGLVGVVLGALGAVLRSVFDRTVRDPRDVARMCGRPVLGPVTRAPTGIVTDDARVAARDLQNVADGPDHHRIVVVTEPETGAGATYAAVALTAALQELSGAAVLVDLDLRSRTLTERLGRSDAPGITDVLEGRSELEEALTKSDAGPFLGSGHSIPAPTEAVGSPALRELTAELGARYCWVVLVCAPVLSTVDATVVGAQADATALVVSLGVTTEEQVRRACEVLPRHPASVVFLDRVPDHPMPTVSRTEEGAGA
ncbi:hypothetical protein GCM10022140_04400 [Rhodococcus aetherivorans]